jgi:hypothetical protein
MNVSSAVGAAVVLASLAVTTANADVAASKVLGLTDPSRNAMIVNADFVQGHETIAGMPARQALVRAEMSKVEAVRYFDFDVIITLGALAIASGAFVAVGIAGSRRRAASAASFAPREGWREEVMQALEADLAHYTMELRQAA